MNNRILVFGDLHLPYQAEEAFDFLSEVKQKYKPDRVVCLGDLLDFYSLSRFQKDPNHRDSIHSELTRVKAGVKTLGKIFPRVDLTMGNHDDRFAIRVASAGIPSVMMKSFGNLIDAPPHWKIHKSDKNLMLTVDATRSGITFAHNRGANTLQVAQRLGQSFVAGHQHSKGQVVGFNNGRKTIFGVNCPCLISNEGSPYAYTQISNINPVRGCCLITAGVPTLELL